MIINPNEYNPDAVKSGTTPEGEYIAQPVGCEYRKAGDKDVINVRFVALESADGGVQHRGSTFDLTFWLTDRAMWVIQNFAWAIRFQNAFDPRSDFDRVLLTGPVRMAIRHEERNGYTNIRTVGRFERVDAARYPIDSVSNCVNFNPSDRALIDAAEERYTNYLSKKSSPDRGYSASSGSSVPTGGRGGSRRSDDDIPF